MPLRSGKQAFIETLIRHGVKYVFGNPGTTELPVIDALSRQSDLQYVLGLSEAACVAMADGYARATGGPAVLNLHTVPGVGNAVNLVYNAYRGGVPLVVTAGQQGLKYQSQDPFLFGDTVSLMQPVTKWSWEIRSAAEVPRSLSRALVTAMTPPRGPVFLSLPFDVMDQSAEVEDRSAPMMGYGVRPDTAAVAEAVRMLTAARQPVIMAGDRVAEEGGMEVLRQIAEHLGAPVYEEPTPGRICFPTDHPLYQGVAPRFAAGLQALLDGHDVLLCIGMPAFVYFLPDDTPPLPGGTRLIHIDSDPTAIGRNQPTALGVIGQINACLTEILAGLRTVGSPAAPVTRSVPAPLAPGGAAGGPMTREQFARAFAAAVRSDDVVVDESISFQPALRQQLVRRDPLTYFGLKGGGLGWALGGAVGIKMALPDRRVIALSGDGAALFGIHSLWSAAALRLPIVFVIINNGGYGILKQGLQAYRSNVPGPLLGMDIDPAVDYPALARAFGVQAETVYGADELTARLRDALDGGHTTLLNVVVDPSVGQLR